MLLRPSLFVLVLLLATAPVAVAQQADTSRTQRDARPDTTQAQRPPSPSDTTRTPPDTLRTPSDITRTPANQARADSLRQALSGRGPQPGGGRGPGGPGAGPGGSTPSGGATFSARDSLVITTDSTREVSEGRLYGESSMEYEGASLKAKYITINFQTSNVVAEGPPSDTARFSRPTFNPGGGGGSGSSGPSPGGSAGPGGGSNAFTGDVLSYNIETKRGRVVGANTQQQEGFIRGETVKVYEDSTVFVRDGLYSTCDCDPDETPAYSLRSSRMKVQDQWVYTGPIQLFVYNIPTPLWLPFGMLPSTQGRRSGPLPPEYGTDPRGRGFYLQNWGWYFAMNDYTDLQLRAGLFTQGSFWLEPTFRYAKRYAYDGQVRVRFERVKVGEIEDPDFQDTREGRLDWRHNQEINPTSRFSADVDLVTQADAVQRNTDNFNDAVKQEIRSSMRYNKNWGGGARRVSVNATQSQNLTSGNVSLTLPNLSFTQRSFKPFEREARIGDERWYERITTNYDLSVTNRYEFRPRDVERIRDQADRALERGDGAESDSLARLADRIEQADVQWYDALFDREKYQLATGNERQPFDFTATHQIPLNTNFRLNRYNLTISPNVRYESEWLLETFRATAIDTTDADTAATFSGSQYPVEEQSVPGFYAEHDFNTGLSLSSELFGTFPLSIGPLEGLRHRARPSLSFNYQPNFNDPVWGRTRRLRTQDGRIVRDRDGQAILYDIQSGRTVSRNSEQRSLNFSLSNTLESKRVRVDSTGERDEETIRILDFNTGGNYNFAADSLKLRLSSLTARTRYDVLDFRVSMDFSPYRTGPALNAEGDVSRDADGTIRTVVVNEYMAATTPWKPARLTSFQFAVGGSFSGGGGSGRAGARRTGGGPTGGRPPTQGGRGGIGGAGGFSGDQAAPASRVPVDARGYPTYGIPWNLRFDFNYRFQKPDKEIENPNASLGVDWGLSPTPNWSLNGRTGYDFVQGRLTTTYFTVNRSLGCWIMSFRWTPFGRSLQGSYSFSLRVNSGQLSNLLNLQVPRNSDGRLGGFGDQLRGTAQGVAGGGGIGGGGGFR